jgi:hypothetical protein
VSFNNSDCVTEVRGDLLDAPAFAQPEIDRRVTEAM